MPVAVKTEDAVRLRFGGGVHSRASEDEIDERECAEGENFLLDLENRQFRPRPSIDLLGTVPNALGMRGMGELQKSDGTVNMFVQAGANVYEWDGTNFTSIGTVDANAKLRGRLEQNWQLDDKVLITDLNLQQPVMEWDGTTFQTMPHNLTGDFVAKYGFVAGERAHFANVVSNAVATPHLLAASKVSDNENLSVSGVPAGAGDPFFLLTPDLRPINGLVEAFNVVVISSEKGSTFKLTGADATDFVLTELYPRSAASGDESVAYVGNDILYGRQGRIESVLATDKFADVQTDDITVPIQDLVTGFKDWITVYNSRNQRVYFFPMDQSQLWVYFKDLAASGLSPWSKWTTQHTSNFNPTVAMNLIDPVDGLEYVFMGDANGNLYRLEGTGTADAGSVDIRSRRVSALFEAPVDAQAYDIEGWIKYRKDQAATVTLTFLYAGDNPFNETVTVAIPAVTGRPTYGGTTYYGGTDYYGAPFAGRLTRQKFAPAGRANEWQVEATIEGQTSFEITEIGLRFEAAS